jgi:hypothetical protein
MYSSNNLFYKSICSCNDCGNLIFDSKVRDLNSKEILLDLNHKRHCCSDADKIDHESKVVQDLLRSIEYINEIELTSFKLRLDIVDGDLL